MCTVVPLGPTSAGLVMPGRDEEGADAVRLWLGVGVVPEGCVAPGDALGEGVPLSRGEVDTGASLGVGVPLSRGEVAPGDALGAGVPLSRGDADVAVCPVVGEG